jgi:hypothetical protein
MVCLGLLRERQVILIDCLLVNIQRQIFHAYSGREQVQQCFLLLIKGGITQLRLLTATDKVWRAG